MVSNAPHNPADIEVDEPTQPYSRAEIDRLRQVAKSPPQEQRRDVGRPEVTHVVTRGMLTVVPAEADDEVAGDQDIEGWFELDDRWLRVCLRCFEHFGFSGAPPGMVGAADASFVSGTIGGERSAAPHPGPRLFEVEQAGVDQAPAPELEPEDLQPFSHLHKWKWWVLVAGALVLSLAAWLFVRIGAAPVQVQSTTRDAEQVRAELPSEPTKAEPPVPVPSAEPKKIVPSEDEPPSKENERKDPAQSKQCREHRERADGAKESGDWELLLTLAERDSCWPSRSEAMKHQLEALFQLGRFSECVQRGGSKKKVQTWVNACKLNL